MKNFIQKKWIRLMSSSNIMKINYFYHKLFGEKDLGNIGFNFTDKPSRAKVVQDIIDIKKYKSYLEIGTFKDELFNEIICEKKVGVDPFSGGTVRKTSDEFFSTNNQKFDCIYIDGLHYYKQVKIDIINSVNALNDNGIILIDDCLPNSFFIQAVPRGQLTWTGDVWKALVEFRTKKDFDCYTCYADGGIGVILKRNNRNLLDLNINNFEKLKFKVFFEKYEKLMNIVSLDQLTKIL